MKPFKLILLSTILVLPLSPATVRAEYEEATEEEATEGVRQRFFTEMCASTRETYFFVGTVLSHGTWVVIGTFYPKVGKSGSQVGQTLNMFPD